MTNQELFNQLISNIATYNRLQYAIKIELDRPGPHYLAALYQASGDLLSERKVLLAEYSQAGMVIFRSTSGIYFWVTMEQLKDTESWIEHEYRGKDCQRLLSNGEWQNKEERERENLRAYFA